MRLARDLGTTADLVPFGYRDILDLPYRLMEYLQRAQTYAGFDELTEDERPPKSIWSRGDKLAKWFEEVKRKRKSKAEHPEIDDPVQNAAAEDLIVGG